MAYMEEIVSDSWNIGKIKGDKENLNFNVDWIIKMLGWKDVATKR